MKKIGRNKKEALKRSVEALLISFGFFLIFGIAIFKELREGMGKLLNALLTPIVAFVGEENFLLIVFILSIITGIYTSFIQKYTIDWEIMEKAKEYQKNIRELQKEYMEARKENNKHKIKKIEKKRKEMMRKQGEISGEMLRQQLKPMAYISIITIPLFMWMYWYVGLHSFEAFFPIVGNKNLTHRWLIIPYWVLWYLICSIPTTQLIRKAIGIK